MLPDHIVIESSEREMLRNVLNEILHGLAIDNLEGVVGFCRSDLENLFECFNNLSGDAQVQITRGQAWASHNALSVTLRELGDEEFHTRTGFDFADDKILLRRLSGLLNRS